MKSLKKYRIFDTNGNILSENKEVMAESSIKAVRLFYRNVKRVKNGHIVVNHKYCYIGEKVFANVKLYKNGNRHVKFCKEFMQKLNVEMARINGCVQDKSEAIKEMDIPADVINSVWKTNLQIGIESGNKLLGLPEA